MDQLIQFWIKSPIAQKWTIILTILYTVGVVCFLLEWDTVIALTPLNLLISAVAIIHASGKFKDIKFIGVCLVCWSVGYGVELLGVQTGFPFGEYWYLDVLGRKIGDTPLIIGVNWLMLVLATVSIVNTFFKANLWLRALLGATLMVSLDFLIEPIAMAYRFWDWKGGIIPIENYIAWWIVAFSLHLLVQKQLKNFTNGTANALFVIQILFFGILNVFG